MVVVFGGAPRCPRCNKSVYSVEEVLVSDNSWHKACLSCNQCNKRLDMRTLMEHRNEIYCSKCHTDVSRSGPSRDADGYSLESPQTLSSPANASRAQAQYAQQQPPSPPSEHGINSAASPPPQKPHRSYGTDVTSSSSFRSANYNRTTTTTTTTTVTTTPSYKSETPQHLSLNTSSATATPHTPPRQQGSSYQNSNSIAGYKRAGEISPSSVFSSGRAKLNIPSTKDTCRRCSTTIFHAEKVVGPGGLWHRACFRCKSCSRALTPAILTDHEGDAYCNNCHNKMFAPRGYNIGGSTEPLQHYSQSHNSGSVDSLDRYSPSRRRSGAVPAAEYEAQSPPRYNSPPNRRESHHGDLSPYGSAAAAAAAAAVSGQSNRSPTSLSRTADPRPSSARSSSSRMAFGRPYKPARQFGLGGPPSDTCHHCQKTIYAMELSYAAGNKYHKVCLKCKDCNTGVDSLKMTEHDGEIYCKGCYAKKYGPNGFRNTLSTSINNF
ncbi:hypothetical protein EV175_000533 [Coemansia sp. RSA 1933]|nr:hypothetical protein EV175_000533 [Coemansia sp. RSA 1933]